MLEASEENYPLWRGSVFQLTFKSVGESDYGHLCNQNPLSLLPSESSVKPAGVMVSPIHLRHTAAAIVTLPVWKRLNPFCSVAVICILCLFYLWCAYFRMVWPLTMLAVAGWLMWIRTMSDTQRDKVFTSITSRTSAPLYTNVQAQKRWQWDNTLYAKPNLCSPYPTLTLLESKSNWMLHKI